VIAFSVICALLIVLALAFILRPLRHPGRMVAGGMAEANVAVYRRQLVEMQSDLRNRIITNEQFERDREELEQRLTLDLPRHSRADRGETPASGPGMLVYALAVGLPLAAMLLYLSLGAPSSLPSP
jgi:cytochrome c-type biogenesis protein CcmH